MEDEVLHNFDAQLPDFDRALRITEATGRAIASGEMRALARPARLGPARLLLLQGGRAVGVARLGEPEPLQRAAFAARRAAHRAAWAWPGRSVVHYHPILEVAALDPPVRVRYPATPAALKPASIQIG